MIHIHLYYINYDGNAEGGVEKYITCEVMNGYFVILDVKRTDKFAGIKSYKNTYLFAKNKYDHSAPFFKK